MWVNAQGNPVAMQPMTVQFDIPCEPSADAPVCQRAMNDFVAVVKTGDLYAIGAAVPTLTKVFAGFNFITVLVALVQVFAALKSGDPQAIMAAVQALFNALMGK